MANKRQLPSPSAQPVDGPVQRPRKNGPRLDLSEAAAVLEAGAGISQLTINAPASRDPAASQSPFIPLAPPVDGPAHPPPAVLERRADTHSNLWAALGVWVRYHPYSTQDQLFSYLRKVMAIQDWQAWLQLNVKSINKIISDQRAIFVSSIRKHFVLKVRSEVERKLLRLWELPVWPELLCTVGARGADGEAFVVVTCQLYARDLNYHQCDPRMVLARIASIAGIHTAIVVPNTLSNEERAKATGDDPAALRANASTPPRSRNRGRTAYDIDELLYQAAASVSRPMSQFNS